VRYWVQSFFNQAVLDPNVQQRRTGSSDICKNGYYFYVTAYGAAKCVYGWLALHLACCCQDMITLENDCF